MDTILTAAAPGSRWDYRTVTVNGEYRELNAGTAMLYPCLQGEKVELQLDLKLDYVPCGDKREIHE